MYTQQGADSFSGGSRLEYVDLLRVLAEAETDLLSTVQNDFSHRAQIVLRAGVQ